jgi:hypothetical protein
VNLIIASLFSPPNALVTSALTCFTPTIPFLMLMTQPYKVEHLVDRGLIGGLLLSANTEYYDKNTCYKFDDIIRVYL